MPADTQDPSATPRPDRRLHVPDIPNWAPLEQIVDRSRCPQFMAMGELTQERITIYLYKHILTRRYLNLDAHGRTYHFTPAGYRPISLPEAILHAFP